MQTSTHAVRFAPSWLAGSVVAALLLTAGTAIAYTGQTKVYGTQYAYNNNFNDSNNAITATFGSGSTPSMTVSYSLPSGQLYGYPAICRGWHYTMNPATDSFFPHQVSAIKTLSGAVAFTTKGSGQTGDFAYDLFFRKDASKGTPQLEVMIWGANNSYPLGTLSVPNAISSGGVSYDLWQGNNDAAGYYVYTFIPHGTAGNSNPLPTSGHLNANIKAFLDRLQTLRSGDGRYSNALYLQVVEGGFEVTGGTGSVSLSGGITAN
ncbi:cellulase [Xanthomonas campestris pv. campestris]|uniref:Cellulase S n=3 Tax=Xanthomonas campestris pv. campestris TaxID=340 RepID=Q8P5G1_XANCP|nr:cellulase [Xanthomonas campestris]AAM42650.1 cellulase S [Xanthomonas campestris pv. campestris str. ATCC 33913]AAY47862.1 cellulase S [Xanthomonas campestris pv. campestris str. 8004]AKS15134.1 cellulase [Xanthomonas campestris pv. campestris]AKS19164.1 cellulase [Xanthomonas campestris pv. campestris]ALE69938.1 cellulase [Xanthomonas campestris pv. campestris]